jgi:hypothetical protein
MTYPLGFLKKEIIKSYTEIGIKPIQMSSSFRGKLLPSNFTLGNNGYSKKTLK